MEILGCLRHPPLWCGALDELQHYSGVVSGMLDLWLSDEPSASTIVGITLNEQMVSALGTSAVRIFRLKLLF